MKGRVATNCAEMSDDKVARWIDQALSGLRDENGPDAFVWKTENSDNAEYRITTILSGDTLLNGLAWRYIGTHTWYVSFEVGKRTKHFYGQRTFKPQDSKTQP
jgi:hypothetical protein